ncbi:MAG: arylsulfatase [Candidatus Aminicenantes bacterium]|nr:arylsulfatase [Candidatus Aminicenantes bacterium]
MRPEYNRRDFLKTVGLGAAALAVTRFEFCRGTASLKPNVIFILADDLGYGELGCFGQEKIRTPNIDRIAAEGMKFTQHYSGSPVCAPSRCVLLTGKHTGHAYIRDNSEMNERGEVWRNPLVEGQLPLPEDTFTIGRMFQSAGYTTGAIGKWGLGGPGTSGEPNNQGFDHWYGYLCQRRAHNYYPIHLWRNRERHILAWNKYFYPHQTLPEDRDPYDKSSYEEYSGKQYSLDLMTEEALGFIRENRNKPFFLYLPFTVPHAAIQVPEDSLHEYEGAFPETPYTGDKGYLPHPSPRAGYAAMVTRMDREIGRIMSLLKELGIDDSTLIIFSSDNGPTFNGGTDSEFFRSAGPLRGLKTMLYEGGIRVPTLARWPGRIKPDSVSGHVSAFWDWLPTFAELLGVRPGGDTDGISLLPTLLGNPEEQKNHDHLYWEYSGKQAVRRGEWKAYRKSVDSPLELYNLKDDIAEKYDLAGQRPDVVKEMADIMMAARVESALFLLKRKKD